MQEYNSEKRKAYSQNFVKNPSLIRYIIDFIPLPPNSLVLDLGAGEGIITKELVARGYRVQAIELDPDLYTQLQDSLGDKATIINQDIRKITYPSESFAIISNPPFAIFSELIKGLYSANNSPESALIFGQKEAIERIIGKTEQSIISIILNSLYRCEIVYNFEADDFSPKPNVDIKLLRLEKLNTPIWEVKYNYIKFISYAFSQQKSNLGKNLESIFTYEQWKRLAKTHQFHIQARPQELSINQWKGLYRYFYETVDEKKKKLI